MALPALWGVRRVLARDVVCRERQGALRSSYGVLVRSTSSVECLRALQVVVPTCRVFKGALRSPKGLRGSVVHWAPVLQPLQACAAAHRIILPPQMQP